MASWDAALMAKIPESHINNMREAIQEQEGETVIRRPQCVDVAFPQFFDMIRKL